MHRPIHNTLFLLITGGALLASGGALQAAGSAGMSCPPESVFSGQPRGHRYGSDAIEARERWMRERIRQQRERMEAMRANRRDYPEWVKARRSGVGLPAHPEYPAWAMEAPQPLAPPQWPTEPSVAGEPGGGDAYPPGPGYAPWGFASYYPPLFAPAYPWRPEAPPQTRMPAEAETAAITPSPEPAPVARPPAVVEPAPVTPAPRDGDGDQVVDGRDLCPGTDPSITVDEFGCPQAVPIVLRGVNFHTEWDRLTEESSAILDGVAATLVANPDIKLEVSGHTDSDGDDAYNKELSQRRAARVKSYLVEKGVAAGNLVARGYGEEQPITGNETASDKAQNRRVELSRL